MAEAGTAFHGTRRGCVSQWGDGKGRLPPGMYARVGGVPYSNPASVLEYHSIPWQTHVVLRLVARFTARLLYLADACILHQKALPSIMPCGF